MPARKLTARFVDTLRTEKAREDYRDSSVRGLQLRVTKSGVKTWTLRYRRISDGRLRRVTLGAYPAVTLESARIQAGEARIAAMRGADPAAAVQARRDAETFRELAAEWIERHAQPNKRERTVRGDLGMLKVHVYPAIGDMKASEISKRDLIRMLDTVAGKADGRMKPRTAPVRRRSPSRVIAPKPARRLTHQPNRVFQLVRSIFRWAISRGMLRLDPTMGLKSPIKKERPRERELSPAEIRRLWEALSRAPVKRRTTEGLPRGERAVCNTDIPMTRSVALALKLSLTTAQRIGEVACISMKELDLGGDAPVWTLPGERSKNGQPSRIPLSPLALLLIREAQQVAGENSSWLFPSPTGDGPIDGHAPTKAVARARSAIGIENFRAHDLRRTAATRMAEMGISPHTISLVLNHVSARSSTITAKVYVQYNYDREKRDALCAWGLRLAQIVAAPPTDL
jgi:integrase